MMTKNNENRLIEKLSSIREKANGAADSIQKEMVAGNTDPLSDKFLELLEKECISPLTVYRWQEKYWYSEPFRILREKYEKENMEKENMENENRRPIYYSGFFRPELNHDGFKCVSLYSRETCLLESQEYWNNRYWVADSASANESVDENDTGATEEETKGLMELMYINNLIQKGPYFKNYNTIYDLQKEEIATWSKKKFDKFYDFVNCLNSEKLNLTIDEFKEACRNFKKRCDEAVKEKNKKDNEDNSYDIVRNAFAPIEKKTEEVKERVRAIEDLVKLTDTYAENK
jgi:hypothetical protein